MCSLKNKKQLPYAHLLFFFFFVVVVVIVVVVVQASFYLLALSTYPVFLCFLRCISYAPSASYRFFSKSLRGREHLWLPMAYSCDVPSQESHWRHQSLVNGSY